MGLSPVLLGVSRVGAENGLPNEAQLQAQLQANSKQSNPKPARARPSPIRSHRSFRSLGLGQSRGGALNPSPASLRLLPPSQPRFVWFAISIASCAATR